MILQNDKIQADLVDKGSGSVDLLETILAKGKIGEAEQECNELEQILDSLDLVSSNIPESKTQRLASLLTRTANIMRKVKRVDSSLKFARRAYAMQSSDIWVIRAYGWALRDAIREAKADNTAKDSRAALDLVLEFDRVQIPDTETLLLEQRAHYHVGLVGTEQHLADAFRSAKQKYRDYPDDPKTAQKYFWVLADCIEQAMWLKKLDLAQQFYAEIDKFPGLNEKQINKKKSLKSRLDPAHALCLEASTLSKQGDHAKAAALYRGAMSLDPDSRSGQEGLGWELARLLQAEIAKENPAAENVKAMLDEYLTLNLVQKPSKLHSWILSSATRVAENLSLAYFLFVKAWDITNLRDEDFKSYQPVKEDASTPSAEPVLDEKHKDFPSLAEKVGMALGKIAKTIKRGNKESEELLVWGEQTLGMLVGRFPQHPWLSYHHAMLLLKTGASDEARKRLIPLVRAKPGEFWTWAAIAETYPAKSKERLTCLCRANSCPPLKNVALLTRVRVNLRDALKAAGDVEASEAVDRLLPKVSVVGFGESAPASLPSACRISAAVSDRVRMYADEAEKLAMADLPWTHAIVSGLLASKAGVKGCVFVHTGSGVGGQEFRVNPKRFVCLNGVKLGAPLNVRLTIVEGHMAVVDVMQRDGEQWDLILIQKGVVSHLNQEKGLAAIATGVDRVVLAYFDHFPEAGNLIAGDVLDLRCQPKVDRSPERLVWFRRSILDASIDFVKHYQGAIRKQENGSFGFVGDVFIPTALIGDWRDGANLSGLAILETNRKTEKKGWRAVTAQNN